MTDTATQRRLVRERLIRENEFPPLPDGWGVERLRFLFTESKERNGIEPVGEMLSVSEYHGVIPRQYDDEDMKRSDEELQNYRVVRPGQLAVNSMWLNHLGLGVSDHLGHVSPAYAAYDISPRLDKRYAHHLVRSDYYLKIYMRYLYGIRPNSFQIKAHDWASIPIIVPDLTTQRQIADFLDRETARIDLLIEKKQRMVEMMSSKRQTLISSAITGVSSPLERNNHKHEWFSDLPTTWRLARVKDVTFRISDGPHISPDYVDEGVPFISARNIKSDRWELDDAKYISDELFAELSRKVRPVRGDVLYTKGGTTGVARYVDLDFDFQIWVHVALLKIRPRVIDARYLAHALNSPGCYEQSQLLTRGATNNDLGLGRIASISFPLPPRNEQEEIVSDLEASLAELDRSASLVSDSITRLREYRSALITAAVTGQIDPATHAAAGTTDRQLDTLKTGAAT